jgi:hypothetical protein
VARELNARPVSGNKNAATLMIDQKAAWKRKP